MIAGANLLALALGVIPAQALTLAKYTGRTENAAGYQVATYAAAVTIAGSVQPVPQSRYVALGLDFAREYVTLYTSSDVVAVARDGSGDKLTYDGKTYLCESMTNWRAQEGWREVIAVRVLA